MALCDPNVAPAAPQKKTSSVTTASANCGENDFGRMVNIAFIRSRTLGGFSTSATRICSTRRQREAATKPGRGSRISFWFATHWAASSNGLSSIPRSGYRARIESIVSCPACSSSRHDCKIWSKSSRCTSMMLTSMNLAVFSMRLKHDVAVPSPHPPISPSHPRSRRARDLP